MDDTAADKSSAAAPADPPVEARPAPAAALQTPVPVPLENAPPDLTRAKTKPDVLAAILPMARRAELATLLTADDLKTLRHLAEKGTGPNTLRAIASDLAYLEAWSQAATSGPLPWPAPEGLALKFIAHHLYDADERERTFTHGMPAEVRGALLVAGCLRADGPHAPATVRRRLALWSTLHRWKGVAAPFSAPSVRRALRLAVRANPRPRTRKSANAVTRTILDRLVATCEDGSFVGVRDKAILLLAFASGGRRRSEIANLRLRDLVDRDSLPPDPADAAPVPVLEIRLGRTKTAAAEADERVVVVGRPVIALKHWIALAGISGPGAVFRGIDRFGRLASRPLDPQSINAILKKRCAMAGLDPTAFSAHGLRSGYLTEAANQGVPLQEAMAQSRHRSIQQAANYYNDVDNARGKAARLG